MDKQEQGQLSLATLNFKTINLLFVLFSLVLPVSALAMEPGPDPNSLADSSEILEKYIQAEQGQFNAPLSMEVDINASVPKLQENGRLHARRVISRVGRITYRVLGFQGSNTVKTQVIARYLQAEQQGQGNPHLAVVPANYKFKLKDVRRTSTGQDVYVFALTPRMKEPGLFKGEMWLDAKSYLPVYEKGRLVKNPSIFFKKVDFERAFSIQGGAAVPQYMNSTITTRLVGRVELDVNYSKFSQTAEDRDDEMSTSHAVASFSAR